MPILIFRVVSAAAALIAACAMIAVGHDWIYTADKNTTIFTILITFVVVEVIGGIITYLITMRQHNKNRPKKP